MKKAIRIKRIVHTASAGVACLVLLLTTSGGAIQAHGSTDLEKHFGDASKEFGVPSEVLKALSYNQSRWEDHNDKPSASGGYGVAHLTTEPPETENGRGEPDHSRRRRHQQPVRHTLDEAASLINMPAETLKKDDAQNIRGAAALLARHARETHDGQLPNDMNGWYDAVAQMSNSPDVEGAQDFADDVYKSMQNGVSRKTSQGETVTLPKHSVQPDRSRIDRIKRPSRKRPQNETECPQTITCKFVPARFAQNNPEDPVDYGNYDKADRPKDIKINQIVIHDTEGTYQSSIDWFQDSRSYVSAHYLIRSSDGEVTQMVKNDDVAWHAGNWYVNMHSIGVEHEGFAAEGATWYTEEMYRSSAELVKYLARKYDIPLDREHIIGHDQFHALRPSRAAGMHWDPGPYWDWDHYMDLLNSRDNDHDSWRHRTQAVTIAPAFATNKPVITQCTDTGCAQLPAQASNFVYLRTAPQETAPLVTDAGLRPDGAASTTEIQDWGAKATSGQHFAVAERQGDWTAVWFNGQKGWFYNPAWASAAKPSRQKLVKPKDGASSIPVYGRPLPEASAYPAGGAPVQPLEPLQYVIPAGQQYAVYDFSPKNDYFHVLAFDRSTPGDGTIVVGNEKYFAISYNHRQAYVKAADVKQAD
jgi:N-acetyl-anhydromuramyl-L-alanine amidase AmpD